MDEVLLGTDGELYVNANISQLSQNSDIGFYTIQSAKTAYLGSSITSGATIIGWTKNIYNKTNKILSYLHSFMTNEAHLIMYDNQYEYTLNLETMSLNQRKVSDVMSEQIDPGTNRIPANLEEVLCQAIKSALDFNNKYNKEVYTHNELSFIYGFISNSVTRLDLDAHLSKHGMTLQKTLSDTYANDGNT